MCSAWKPDGVCVLCVGWMGDTRDIGIRWWCSQAAKHYGYAEVPQECEYRTDSSAEQDTTGPLSRCNKYNSFFVFVRFSVRCQNASWFQLCATVGAGRGNVNGGKDGGGRVSALVGTSRHARGGWSEKGKGRATRPVVRGRCPCACPFAFCQALD